MRGISGFKIRIHLPPSARFSTGVFKQGAFTTSLSPGVSFISRSTLTSTLHRCRAKILKECRGHKGFRESHADFWRGSARSVRERAPTSGRISAGEITARKWFWGSDAGEGVLWQASYRRCFGCFKVGLRHALPRKNNSKGTLHKMLRDSLIRPAHRYDENHRGADGMNFNFQQNRERKRIPEMSTGLPPQFSYKHSVYPHVA